MKKIVTLAFLGLSLNTMAVDRIVEEFGVSPTYPNIGAAVTAAVDGDRIIIKNRAGDIPWIQDITVNKSLQFLSYANDDFFIVQGNYTITAADDRAVLMIGMRNTSGSILTTGSSATTRSASVRLVDSFFVNGSVILNNSSYNVDVIGCTFQNGTVSLNFGNVVGNDIDGTNFSDDAIGIQTTTGSVSLDTCAIVGNKVKAKMGYSGIFVSTLGQVVHIRNNYIQHGWMGVQVYEGNTSGVQNIIWNNTITAYTGNFTTYAINLANTNPGSIWEVMNNAITRTWTGESRGINNDSGNEGQINVYYNHISNNVSIPVSAGFTFAGNNTVDQPIALDTDGTFNGASAAVDGGNPAAPFYDLDLSAGDAGAYGGSYTLTNFHPLHTGAARVYMVGHPFNVRQGTTLRVKATGYDR